jgi:glycosyltransferase involved in cell wall biosynthesis
MEQLAVIRRDDGDDAALAIDMSTVMPSLNEAISLPHCIANARQALAWIEERHGVAGDIVVADNGSTDGSHALGKNSAPA